MNTERLRISYVPDGDTLRAFTARGEEVRIRLAYVDAPEMSQAPYGLAARAYLRKLLNLQELIELRKIGTDIHGRSVGEVIRLLKGLPCQQGTSCPDQLARALEAVRDATKRADAP